MNRSEYDANRHLGKPDDVIIGKDFMKPGPQRNRTKQRRSLFAWMINLYK